jgi:hypothetical protein
MDLIFTCGLGGRFPRLDLADHLQFELTPEPTSFQRQGCGLFSVVKEV